MLPHWSQCVSVIYLNHIYIQSGYEMYDDAKWKRSQLLHASKSQCQTHILHVCVCARYCCDNNQE